MLDSLAYQRLLPSSKDLWGEKIQRGNSNCMKKKKFSDTSGEEDSMFAAETASLLDLFPELSKEDTEMLKSIHDFSVNCGIPNATIAEYEKKKKKKKNLCC